MTGVQTCALPISMTNIPFRESSFDIIICANLIEVAKELDLKNQNTDKINGVNFYPILENTISEIRTILKNEGVLFLTTPNNSYYKTIKLEFDELNSVLKNHFTEFSMNFFNIYPKLSGRYRKLNLANTIPKLLSVFVNKDYIIKKLVKKKSGRNMSSVSFYVEAIKND